MKPLATLSFILLTGAIAAPAFAATTIDGMNVPVPTPRPALEMAQASAEPMTRPDASGQDGQAQDGQAMDMMSTGAIAPSVSGVEDFKAIDVARIAVMRVDEVADEDTREQYRLLSDSHSADMRKLQSDIRTNADLVAALEAQQVDVDQVISVQQNGDGSVTFIVL
ncbi:hypothetical protein [Rhizobium sp. GN54]|uniref:hypothetical protein n=1 Tax=Rhizobium sp. GN54 TaxID=2898150 RepID=UPI001E6135C4|nr:hypothetical protein [Rhizobium sp. GN54]MCD2181805.1 hypothetical protein [Rhizobium sp. GN54]